MDWDLLWGLLVDGVGMLTIIGGGDGWDVVCFVERSGCASFGAGIYWLIDWLVGGRI